MFAIFIQKNYTPYEGDASFLAPATEATTKLWADVLEGIKVENRTHEPYKIDAQIISGITSHAPGYINKDWNHRRPANRRAFETFHHAVWRFENGARRVQSVQR